MTSTTLPPDTLPYFSLRLNLTDIAKCSVEVFGMGHGVPDTEVTVIHEASLRACLPTRTNSAGGCPSRERVVPNLAHLDGLSPSRRFLSWCQMSAQWSTPP